MESLRIPSFQKSLFGLFVAFFMLLGSQLGCTVVRYYKVSDVRKGFKNTQAQTEKGLKHMTRDVQRHRSVITKAMTQRRNLTMKPYPEMKRLVGAMGKIRDKLVYQQQDIAKLRKRFERIVGPRRLKVQSNEADYPRVRKVMDELKILHKDMKSLVKRYKSKSSEFRQLMVQHKIR
jgi:hypothetical protein